MLLKFKVGNFLSIKNKQELSMLSKIDEDDDRTVEGCMVPILRSTYIYGPNSSGKSSLIRAFIYSRGRIVGMDPINSKLSTDFKNRINTDFSHMPHDNEDGGDVSYFEYMIQIGEHVYSYGFETISRENIITSEWLVEYWPNGRSLKIIDRDQVGMISIEGSCPEMSEKIKTFNLRDRKNTELFLSYIGHSSDTHNLENIIDVYRWFRNELIIRTSDSTLSGIITADEGVIKYLSKKMKKYDTGVDELAIEKMRDIPTELTKKRLKKIDFKYDLIKEKEMFLGIINDDMGGRMVIIKNEEGKVMFNDVFMVHEKSLFKQYYKDESDGTKRILQMLLMLAPGTRLYSSTSDYSKPRTIIIDEMDRSIHTNIVREFVKDFINDREQKNNQLITTVHESHILPYLRTDEVWFINKNENNESVLYPLERYRKNYNGNMGELYLEGRFGAIPNLSPIRSRKVE